MWFENLPQVSPDQFGELRPVEVLYEFEGPKIYTAFDARQGMVLCYQCEEIIREQRYQSVLLVVPCSNSVIARLKRGGITVHDALNQPWLWIVEKFESAPPLSAWKCDGLSEVPSTAKPQPDVTLWPELTPLLSYRLIGEGLGEGSVPASVVAAAVNKPTLAIRRLLQNLANRPSIGRPENAFRDLYNLRATRMAFNSFEIAFQPSTDQKSLGADVYADGTQAFEVAQRWLEDDQVTVDLSVLELLDALTPPIHGPVTHVEVKGRLLKNSKFNLSREHTRKVRRAIASKKTGPQLISTVGRIRELDMDRKSFMLREREDGAPDLLCSFNDDQIDFVLAALEEGSLVAVQGRTSQAGRLLETSAIEEAESD